MNALFGLFWGIPFLLPLLQRVLNHGFMEPAGMLSDIGLGLSLCLVVLFSPHLIRIVIVLLWALFQTGSQELHAVMQRLPSWQDMQYLVDPDFVGNTAQGFHFAHPVWAAVMVLSVLLCSFVKMKRPGKRTFWAGVTVAGLILVGHGILDKRHDNQSIDARYNPLHWFITDAAASLRGLSDAQTSVSLPPSLARADLSGVSLVGKGKAKNVLLIVLEGIPGLYHPDIRTAMGVSEETFQMSGLVKNTTDAMLTPDFVAHSHQTIRGLYSMLCGDFSKFSYDTPKAYELLHNPAPAKQCLPAQMAENGWETHYLQGAGLVFMSKDRVMPVLGFQQVHGSEWFTEPNSYLFPWGATDQVLFRGARKYLAELRKKEKPWMLTLLTVGTHQPYAVPEEIVNQYPNRRDASVGMLDQAVAGFLEKIREDGVLEDTLVIVTSDESHGSELADWVGSWGLMAILAPEQEKLPRIKKGNYGLVDVTVSVLDYFGLKIPASVIGRSLFRDYATPRDLLAYTGGKYRWHTGGDKRYECLKNQDCTGWKASSLIGFPQGELEEDEVSAKQRGSQIVSLTATLDRKLIEQGQPQALSFANGEIRELPERLYSEWTQNLTGAVYLAFPEKSKARVSIRIKALETPEQGIQLRLSLRQFEKIVQGVEIPRFPVLHAGETGAIEFEIDNPQARQAFSFHLVGEGKDAKIRMEEFNVIIEI